MSTQRRRSTVALAGTGALLVILLLAARAPSRAEGAAVTPGTAGPSRPGPADAMGMRVAPVRLQSAGVMQFPPDGTLLLADPRAATVYAIDVADPGRDTTRTGVRIDRVDDKIAAALGTTRDQLRIVDMVAHPHSQTLYFSLTRGRGDQAVPLLVSVTKVEETVTVLPLESIRHASALLADAPPPEKKTSWGQPMRQLSITDLALADGEVLVAGLSNEEFASTLRRLKYPFTSANAGVAATTVEIFHTSHDRYETASPIESFLPIVLDGRPSLVAGYGCSPIATFNRADLATTRHLRGRTIAELGGGNRPFDMIEYRNAQGKRYILIGNSDRTITRLDPEEVASAPALVTPVKAAYENAGVGYLSVASFGVVQLDDYNPAFVVTLQRNRDDGSLQVASLTKRML
jgi:hypothetical protein